jgi:5-formyltetrahydrofolate cyclo-ligase
MVVDQRVHSAKRALRQRLMVNRAGRPAGERATAADALCARVLALPEVEAASAIACYVATPEEPGTDPLLLALSARGCSVLLPVLQPDFDLSWAAFEPGALRSGRLGIREPTGTPLGREAVQGVSVVVCPALAADELGRRLGRGGGSYDRALVGLPSGVLRVVLVYDDEVLPAVPVDRHDEPVHVIVTPTRTVRARVPRPGVGA